MEWNRLFLPCRTGAQKGEKFTTNGQTHNTIGTLPCMHEQNNVYTSEISMYFPCAKTCVTEQLQQSMSGVVLPAPYMLEDDCCLE